MSQAACCVSTDLGEARIWRSHTAGHRSDLGRSATQENRRRAAQIRAVTNPPCAQFCVNLKSACRLDQQTCQICGPPKSACLLSLHACQICALAKSARRPDLRACQIYQPAKSAYPPNLRACWQACQICMPAKSAGLPNLRACQICALAKSASLPNLQACKICVLARSARRPDLRANKICVPADLRHLLGLPLLPLRACSPANNCAIFFSSSCRDEGTQQQGTALKTPPSSKRA